ncbi:MAG: response regulator transcription factor [Bacteroidota bacterium]
MAKVNLIVVDENYFTRKGVVYLLNKLSWIETVHELESYNQLSEAIQLFQADIILISSHQWQLLGAGLPIKNTPKTVVYGFQAPISKAKYNAYCSLEDTKESWIESLHEVVKRTQKTSEEPQISAREKEIVKHIALGYTNKEIAEKLYLSTHTVVTHRKNITNKLGIKTVSGLTIYAILNKLIRVEENKGETQ